MDEMIKFWLIDLYEREIEEAKGTIDNESLWSLGYDGDGENPHPENIQRLKEYVEILEEKIKELE